MPSHGLNQPSAYISHGLNAAGAGEASTQPSPSPTPRRKAVAPARAARISGGGGGAFGHAALFAFAMAYQPSPTMDVQLRRAVDATVTLAQDPKMHEWLSTTLSAEATRGRTVQTDFAVAEIILERLQVEGAAPIVKATQLAAGYVALGLRVVLVGHDGRRPLTAVYLDGKWAYADPSTSLPVGGHEPFKREKFYQIPPLPNPAPTKAELELKQLRIEMEQARREIEMLRAQIETLESAMLKQEEWMTLHEEERARKVRAVLVIAGVAVSAVAIIWWMRARAASASDETGG